LICRHLKAILGRKKITMDNFNGAHVPELGLTKKSVFPFFHGLNSILIGLCLKNILDNRKRK